MSGRVGYWVSAGAEEAVSDDIREVMRPTHFAATRRVSRKEAFREGKEREGAGRRHSDGERPSDEPAEDLERELIMEVESANARLAAAGRTVRLRLAAGKPGLGSTIEILLPRTVNGETGVVTRVISPDEFGAWVARLETAEGIMIDEKI